MDHTAFKARRKYALIGGFFAFGVHTIFFIGNMGAVGYYIGDLYPFLIIGIPLFIISGLTFFALSSIKRGYIRLPVLVVAMFVILCGYFYSL